MPNPRGRGRTAQDAHRILSAERDPETGGLVLATAGHPDPIRHSLPDTRLGRQLMDAIWAMIPHAGLGGGWASETTVRRAVRHAKVVHDDFTAEGIQGVDDPGLTFADFLRARGRVGSTWRGTRRAIASALREHHPNGDRMADQLLADRLDSTIATPTVAYDEDEAGVIEDAARSHFLAWVAAHRRFLADIGIDTDDRNWIRRSAEDVLTAARTTATPAGRLLQWHVETGEIDDPAVESAIAVTRDDLAAAAVLLCLADNLGHNWSALQSMTGASIQPTGPDGAVIDAEKARAHTGLRVASSTADLHTFGGIATALAGLTRFARHRRAAQATTPQLRRNADLLFVPTGSTRVLTSPSATTWADRVAEKAGQPVSMRRLRETANLRGRRETGRGTAVGHSEDQNLRYLAEGMPTAELAGLVVEAQDDIVERARRAVRRDPAADTTAVERLAEDDPDTLVDRGVATCGNGARDPDTDAWCNRGILACFTCPSGYRTPANIPGLAAAVALTDRIRNHDPDEWDNGPAATLNFYARAALDQFPDHHTDVDPAPMLPVVAANYWEIRG